MLTQKNSTQRKWHRCAQLVILAFVVTIFSSCSKGESADMSFLALLGGGGGGEEAAPTDPSGPGAGSPGGDSTPPTVLIQNLRDKGIVETGFLLGAAADETGLAAVEVSLDGGTYTTATGTTSWSYKMPTGSSTWRDHSQHTISVRSKDSAGNYSSVTTITVRKGINKDINGDGYADVVVGAEGYGSNTGRAYVFHSSGHSGVAITAASSASTIITGEATGDYFGASIVTGDMNGDGFADVVVGAHGYGLTGRAYVFHSTGSGGVTITSAASASTIITGQTSNSQLGFSVATGDVNGDGYADVVVGARGYGSNIGRTYVFHSSGLGGVAIVDAGSASSIITGTTGSGVGDSVATGDVNGDGYADVVVGYRGGGTYNGRVYVFHSSGSDGVTITTGGSASSILTGDIGFTAMFGYSVATGDVNGDGYVDVVVGAYNYSTYTGRVYVFHSAGSSGVTTGAAASGSSTITGEIPGSKFGFSIATGDINGDGYGDVLVGAQGYSSDTGRGYVFHSSGSGGVSITSAASASTIITAEAGSLLGISVATGDVNGDGYADVVMGASNYSSGAGRAYLFHSSGTGGVTITAAASASTIITGEGSGNQFGRSVAAGDVNGDGYADVVVGASDYISYTGRVYVFHSSGGGVTSTSAASASTIITGEGTSNSFGSSVATGDVNADGFVDVVVAARGYSSVTGRSYVFHSSGTGGVAITAAASASTIITGEGSGNQFGRSVAAGDVNGDGYADVVVGAPLNSSSTGRAYVFHSTGSSGVTITSAASASTIITGEGSSNVFGSSVAMRATSRSSLMISSTPFTELGDTADYGSCVDRMWLTMYHEASYRPPSMGRHSSYRFDLSWSDADRPQIYAWVSG